MNIRSLPLHCDDLISLLSNVNIEFKVIGLSEVKISKDAFVRPNIDIPGYKFYYTSSNSCAGGVGIYVKSNMTVNKRDDLSCCENDFESIWIEIINPKAKNILCCCVYRHPNTDITRFIDYFQDKLSIIEKENKMTCIMGDFNINLIDYSNHAPMNDFINMMFSHHLQPSIFHPTRITDTTSTLIDNIFISHSLSDHLPQFCTISDFKHDYKSSSHLFYDYSQFDVNKFLMDYSNMDLSFLTDNHNGLNEKFDQFLHNLRSLVNNHCPQKRISKKRMKLRNKPWINSRSLEMMRIRDRLFKQFKSTKSEIDLKAFKKFRNRVVNELNESKKIYYHQYFAENKSNMKKLWKGIKSIVNLRFDNIDTTSHVSDKNGIQLKDPVQIANQFNHYFTSVVSDITKNIPRNPKTPLSYLTNSNQDSLFIYPCTSAEVSDVIKSLKIGKASGPNSIPIKLLKLLDPLISVSISFLINESFQTSTFPDMLKIAKVIPVFKKGLTSKLSNYRPISLLSIFSKIFEKLMYQRLYNFLERHESLFNLQFGFRSGHSTDHALVSLAENIRSSLDNNRFGCGIFIDLQKAFDTVNHDILLRKLEHCGIRRSSQTWFKSYLHDRKQFISVNGHSSFICKISCGVPQGSVLGPLLFVIYINDLPNSSKLLKFFLFADDTNIYFQADDHTRLIRTVNKELKKLKCGWIVINLHLILKNKILYFSTLPERKQQI